MLFVLAVLPMPHACSKEKSCDNCLHNEGKVLFYTVNGCVNSRPIKLYINNKEYLIEQANFSVPECGGPTASEFNNDHFEIERSKDGTRFNKVGEIAGKGNSTDWQQYTFYDEQPVSGKAFYRLKQVDIDGRFEYSNIQSVLSEDLRSVVFYPNPVYGADIINIYLTKPGIRQMKILIHDMSGRELFSESKNNVQNNIQIKPNLTPGIYIVQVIGETMIAAEKIMIIK